jgi:hypothetical protein
MKRLLFVAALGLAVLLQIPGRSSASGAFGLFTCGGCCKKCGCEVCIRPYNAFSPVLCGSICVDNCFPLSGPQCACAPPMGAPWPMPIAPMTPFAPGPWGGAMPPMQGPAPMPYPQGAAPMPGALPAVPPQGQPAAPPPVGAPNNPEPLKPPMPGQTIASGPQGTMPYGMVQPVNHNPYGYQGYVPYYPQMPWVPMYPYPYPMMP